MTTARALRKDLRVCGFAVIAFCCPYMKAAESRVSMKCKCEQIDAAELPSAVSHMVSQPRQPADLGRYASIAMKNLNCHPDSCAGKIDARVVKALSKRFKLDPGYLECLAACHGGEPQLNTVQVANEKLTLAFFLTMLDGKSRLPGEFQPHFAYPTVDARVINSVDCVMDCDSNTSRCLFGKLVPFAATQKGMCLDGVYVDLFCFDYRQTLDPPPIVLWVAHCAMDAYFDWDDLPFEDQFDETGCCANVPWNRFLKPIADSFSEFVLMLEQSQ